MIALKKITQQFSIADVVFVIVLVCVFAFIVQLASQASPASPDEVKEAVLECPSLRKEVELTETPFSKKGLQKLLNNCHAVELQKSALPK